MSKTLAPSSKPIVKTVRPFSEDSDFVEAIAQDQGAPLRVALDGTALYGVYGGVEYSLWNLLLALNSLGAPHQWTVFIPQDGPSAEQLATFGPQWQWRRLPFEGTAKARRIFWQQFQLPQLLDEFDLLHAPTYVAPLRSPIPVVLGVYDVIALTHPEFATRTNRLHYGFVLPRALRHAAHVVVPSAAVRDDVESFAPGQNVSVVPLGVEPIFHQDIKNSDITACRKRYDLPAQYLFFAGNFEPKKNLTTLLKAHALLPDAPPLIIAGGARGWPGHEIAADGKRVRVLGHVPRQDLPLLYAGCDAFVFPTLAEGFCLPVVEALAAGAPVVTTNAVPLPDIQSVVKLCEAQDASSIAHAIQSILQNPEEARQIRRAGRAYARDFTWERTAQQTLEVYEAVCQSVKRAPKNDG
jgi:alpha-1,3-rhamnosyl/mannosyltransferase